MLRDEITKITIYKDRYSNKWVLKKKFISNASTKNMFDYTKSLDKALEKIKEAFRLYE